MTPNEQDEFLKKLKESYIKREKKIRRFKTLYLWLELILTFSGYIILFTQNGWIFLGVLLATMGNNLGIIRTIHQDRKNNLNDIWKE